MVASGPQSLSRSVDKVLEETQLSGVLCLHARNLKIFPNAACKYELSDTWAADLSHNRLTELPVQVCHYGYLETLLVYHNCLRSIPPSVNSMHSLTFIDLSRNQLTAIPPALCQLPLEVLLLGHNKLEYLPREIKQMAGSLTELDVCCNRLTYLPLEMGELDKLKALNLRDNLLSDLPSELCRLRLRLLDVSSNRLSQLPLDLRLMKSLVELKAIGNPLTVPQAKLCTRGKVHVFKCLEIETLRRTKRKGVSELDWHHRSGSLPRVPARGVQSIEDSKYVDKRTQRRMRNARFNTIGGDSGYASTGDENRLSQELSNGLEPCTLRRSPPVGEEAPPPPPCLSKPKPPKSGSFVQEVMSACMELSPVKTVSARLSSNSTTSSIEGSPTPKATPIKPDSECFDFATEGRALFTVQTKVAEKVDKTPPRHARSEEIAGIYTAKTPEKPQTDVQTATPERVARAEVKTVSERVARAEVKQGLSPVLEVPVMNGVGREEKKKRTGAIAGLARNSGANIGSKSGTKTNPAPPTKKSISPSTSSTISHKGSLSSSQSSVSSTTSIGKNNRANATAARTNTQRNTAAIANNKPTAGAERSKPRDSLGTARSSALRRSTNADTAIENMRKILERRLEVSLPQDRSELSESLSDGVHLCNYVNRLRVRAVPSVHTPLATAPLSAAKSRRNVENFLIACRRLGVPDDPMETAETGCLLVNPLPLEPIATVLDILESCHDENNNNRVSNSRLERLLASLGLLGFLLALLWAVVTSPRF